MVGGKSVRIRHRVAPAIQLLLTLVGAIVLIATSTLMNTPHASAAVPTGFADSVVMSVGQPTDIAFTPAGTMLVTSQTGQLYKRTGSTTTKVLDISGRICSNFERGLLGVVVDPEFESNGYIYLYYTANKHGSCAYNSSSSPRNRVSRFVFAGNSVSSEKILVDNIYSLGGNHNGGGLAFGNDGYLYIAIGDSGCQLNASGNCAGANQNARFKNILNGKVLRITRDGGVPSSNPFASSGNSCASSGSTTAGVHCKETYSWGLRNPFRIANNPNASGTQVFANDVGQDEWEEIDQLGSGNDYGWNNCEGYNNNYGGGTCGFADTNPLYVYGHGSCNSITGGAFIPNGSWPSTYNNTYFFADYTCGTIWTLKNSGGSWSRTSFATGLGAVTELEFGSYNNGYALYYANYGSGQIRRIAYTADTNRAPVADIDASDTYGALPLEVDFDGRDSSDPDGDTLTYKWDFGDGTSSTSSHPSKTFNTARDYTVKLTVSDGRGGSDTDSVKISAGNTRPTATITSPSSGSTFSVGQTITLKGVGMDAEDGQIPSSRYTWEVWLHHDTHYHPFFGSTSGYGLTFKAPAPEDLLAATNSYLEIRLTVRDSTGLGKLVTMNLMPNKVNVTVGANTPGMKVWIEGIPYTAPATVVSWANNPLTVEAPDQIGSDNVPYLYKSWSDGGTRKHDYVTPNSDATVTITYLPMGGFSYAPHADARVSEGNPDRNEGTGTGLSIKGGSTSDYESYIRFKLSGVGTSVTKARLYIYSYEGSIDGPDVYLTSSSFSESGITWNNRPSATSGRIETYGPVAKGSWIALDVTGYISGDGYVTFLLRSPSSDAASFYSRQAGSTKAPRLVIVSNGSGPSSDEPGVVVTMEPTTVIAPPTTEATSTAVATEVPTLAPTVIETAEPTVEATEIAPTEPASPVPFSDSFENGLGSWQGEGGTTRAVGPDGSGALILQSDGSTTYPTTASYVRYGTGSIESAHIAFDLKINGTDASPLPLVTLASEEGEIVAAVYVLQDGTLVARWAGSDQPQLLGQITLGEWQRVEVGLDASNGAGTLTVWVNGVAKAQATGSVSPVASVVLGSWATDQSFAVAIDNLAIDQTCIETCAAPVTPAEATSEPVVEAEGTPGS